MEYSDLIKKNRQILIDTIQNKTKNGIIKNKSEKETLKAKNEAVDILSGIVVDVVVGIIITVVDVSYFLSRLSKNGLHFLPI